MKMEKKNRSKCKLFKLKAVDSPPFAFATRASKKLTGVTFPGSKAAPERRGYPTSTHLLNFHTPSDHRTTESKRQPCLLARERVSFSQKPGGKVFPPPSLNVRSAELFLSSAICKVSAPSPESDELRCFPKVMQDWTIAEDAVMSVCPSGHVLHTLLFPLYVVVCVIYCFCAYTELTIAS